MNNWKNFQQNYLINQRGQSLVELASFGAVLLLCVAMLLQYGIQANYQQNLQMQAFRRAMRIAYYRSGPGATTSLSVTQDKSIPDPRDSWGDADRRPMSASATVTWDSNLQALYIDDFDETPREADLPRSIIEINNINDTKKTLGLSESDIQDGAIDNINSAKGAFKTADYGQGGCSGSIMMVLENTPSQRTALREEYRTVFRNCNEIRVKNRKGKEDDVGKTYAYVKIDGLQHTVSSADVDNDREVETIIAVKGTQACDEDGYCGRVSAFKYVDDQRGEIVNECTMIYPWETEKLVKCRNAKQQGLIQDYTLIKIDNNRLVKTESPGRSDTVTTLGGSQIITHTIRKNDGSSQNYTTTFTPVKDVFSMGAAK